MNNKTTIIELDALRGIAAIVVLIHHFMLGFTPRLHGLLYPDQPYSMMGTPAFALINGSAAVIIFFVLSGFVLTIGLFRNPGTMTAAFAILKRWPRLAATVMAANLLAGIFMAFGWFQNLSAAQIVPSIWLGWFYKWPSAGVHEVSTALNEGATTFLTGRSDYNSNLWTMYFEFWGSIIAIGTAAACTVSKSSVHQAAVLTLVWAAAIYFSPFMSTFIVGVWLARLYVHRPTASWTLWQTIVLATTAIVLLGYHENLFSGRPEQFYSWLTPIAAVDPLRLRVLIHTIAAVLMMLLFLRAPAVRRAMSGQVGRVLGFMSFAIYLVQIVVISSASSWTFQALVAWPQSIRIVLTFLVTIVGTALLAIPLAFFDRWWVIKLRGLFEFVSRKGSGRATTSA